jgi:RNA polymerase sigma factor (sigma-70 family)
MNKENFEKDLFNDDYSVGVFLSGSFDSKVKKRSEKIDLEKEVFRYTQQNDSGAFDRLYNYFKPHFERISFQKKDEDLIQELSVVLWNATSKYDFSSGYKFKTFFWTCVHNHIGTKKIRQGAKKRSGAQSFMVKTYNHETNVEEYVEQVVTATTVSIHLKVNSTDDQNSEIGCFIESEITKNDYLNLEKKICLEKLASSEFLKDREKKAIMLFLDGYNLKEIGVELGGLTASAIHFMFKRLSKKEKIKEILLDVLT